MRPILTTGALLAATMLTAPTSANAELVFNRVATFPVVANLPSDRDAATATVSEIIAATEDGMMLVYTDSPQEALGMVDITDPKAPKPAGFIPLDGEPTSVAILGGKALVGVVTSDSKAEPSGHVAVIDIASKTVESTCDLAGQPDSVALSKDGATLTVVLENERDEDLNDGVIPQLPSGALTILPIAGGTIDCAGLKKVELAGLAEIAPEDAEPEYVDTNEAGEAVVTLQENNHIAIVDLARATVTAHFPAGMVDLEGIDTEEDGIISATASKAGVKREPDTVQWIDADRFVTANEGDYEGGSRGFTIFSKTGEVLFDSGNTLEHLAMRIGHYPEGRSDAKGTEPEGVEVGRFGDETLIFVGTERSSFVAVYRDTGAEPEFLQVLPSGIGPEGLLAIPSRNLFVTANEADLVEDGGARATVMVYERAEGTPAYPMIEAAADAGFGWGALSGLAADPATPGKLYAVSDSAYSQGSIYEIDATQTPARIVRRMAVMKDGAAVEKLDLEGIATRPEGGFWLASEGNPKNEMPNRLLRVSAEGVVEEDIALPDSIAAGATASGFEGVAVEGIGADETVWIAVQREWADDEKGSVKLLSYKPASAEWGVVRYPLDPAGEGWVGLSEITALGGGRFAIVERDNLLGEAAKLKALTTVSLAGIAAAAPGAEAPTVEKKPVRDFIDDLKSANGYVVDKVEGFAVDVEGTAYMMTDNDGVDDSSGETLFFNLGKLDLTN